jgi:hypothetical protein
VGLSVAATTRVLAYYGSASGQTSTDPLTGLAIVGVTISGIGACDLLYDPPAITHPNVTIDPKLQILNRYATTATASTADAFVRNPSSGARAQDFQAVIGDSGYIEVRPIGLEASGSMTALDRARYRQPFDSVDMSWIYTTDFASTVKPTDSPVFTRNVVVRSYSSSAMITIDKDYVAGSIQVTRGGVPDYSFTANADTGVVTFANPPGPAEDIVVSYLRESSERKSGILVGALGGFWDLGAGRSAYAALGATWSIPGSSYSSGADSSPGSISLTAGEKNTTGPFKSDAAIAAQYSRDDSTGIYRIEGMESTSDYALSFRPADTNTSTFFTAMETAESDLVSNFPSQTNSFHRDGSTQKALEVTAGPTVSNTTPTPSPDAANYYKVEDTPTYPSYKTFSFYARLPPDATLSVSLDDGASPATTSVGMVIPPDGTRSFAWKRYALHYGNGDASVYVQDSEGASERVISLPGVSSTSPSITSTGSRLVISVSGLAAGEIAWVDEVLLQDSVGRTALLFQGVASYDNPDLKLGSGRLPILSNISAEAFAQGALNDASYASGGGSVKATLGFLGLGLHAKTVVSDAGATFSGGHSLELPAAGFPVQLKDDFDYDPATGAFGRLDSLAIQGGNIASLSLKQSSAWTPATSLLDASSEQGMLVQDWEGSLSLGPSIATFGLSADNRTLPTSSPSSSGSGNDYAAAWLGSFEYALPAFESQSDLREAKATVSVKGLDAKEYLSASLGESTTPAASSSGTRADTASLRLAAPFPAFGLSLEPYYSRSLTEQQNGVAQDIVGDAQAALDDMAALPFLYRGIPFAEIFSPGTAADFQAETSPGGASLPAVNYTAEAGLNLAREYGSHWYDLLAPSALSVAYGRNLVRATDTVTDATLLTGSAKIAAVNVFGAMGAHSLGLPFDSDEYLSTIQANLSEPRDGSAPSLNLTYHGLATFYAGQSDRLDVESKASIAELPSSVNWSASLSLALSRRLLRNWLLDLYSAAMKPAQSKADDGGQGSSIALHYLDDLAKREPNIRSTWTLVGGLSGVQSDATAYQPGWELSEAYEAKLTVPERLTLKLDATLNQSLTDSTQVFDLGFVLSINAIISF